MTGTGTLELRQDLGVVAVEMFADYGHALTILYSTADSGWGSEGSESGLSLAVRGLLMPADVRHQQAAAGAGLPVPQFTAYLPFTAADLSVPGWHILHEGQHYYPTADARDESGQGVLWTVDLGAPGEVTKPNGESESGWTG